MREFFDTGYEMIAATFTFGSCLLFIFFLYSHLSILVTFSFLIHIKPVCHFQIFVDLGTFVMVQRLIIYGFALQAEDYIGDNQS